MKWNIMQLWAEGFWSTYGVSFSWTCEANQMSRCSIWSEAGSCTQRPNRNYVSHRGDVHEDCLAPFVVNKSTGKGERAGYGPPSSYPRIMVLSTCWSVDWKWFWVNVCVEPMTFSNRTDSVWFYHQCCNRFPPPWPSNLYQWPWPSNCDLGVVKSTSPTLPLSIL